MNQHNNPPFFYGQQIVRTGNTATNASGTCTIVKGRQYTSAGCFKCEKCNRWKVMLLEHPYMGSDEAICSCYCSHGVMPYYSGWCEKFAPIITKRDHSNVAIEQSIKDMPIVEERSDVKPEKVTV